MKLETQTSYVTNPQFVGGTVVTLTSGSTFDASSPDNPNMSSSSEPTAFFGLPLFLDSTIDLSDYPKLLRKLILSYATKYYFKLKFNASVYSVPFLDLLFNYIPAKFYNI